MTTRFNVGDKVYYSEDWGWVEEIRVSKFGVRYLVRCPDGHAHYKAESALRKEYERKEESPEQ